MKQNMLKAYDWKTRLVILKSTSIQSKAKQWDVYKGLEIIAQILSFEL